MKIGRIEEGILISFLLSNYFLVSEGKEDKYLGEYEERIVKGYGRRSSDPISSFFTSEDVKMEISRQI